MGLIKRIYHNMVRIHFKSYLVYLTIAGLCLFKKKRINNLYTRRFKVVHIVCPGPSATALLEYKFGPNETIIFINHAIKMSSKVIGPKEKFYFSSLPLNCQLHKAGFMISKLYYFSHINNRIICFHPLPALKGFYDITRISSLARFISRHASNKVCGRSQYSAVSR